MGHTPDKANESFFGFNSVLPGAYSIFKWKAIKGDPLEEFFKKKQYRYELRSALLFLQKSNLSVAIIGEVLPDGAAEKSGLLQFDEIISANGITIDSWSEWVNVIRNSPGQQIDIEVLRGNETVSLILIPAIVEKEDKQLEHALKLMRGELKDASYPAKQSKSRS